MKASTTKASSATKASKYELPFDHFEASLYRALPQAGMRSCPVATPQGRRHLLSAKGPDR